ncbi:LLM class flavin-dependent oxidoreductase [Salininema proteolyticum]|uniref:LLM class flavin-dependent oxidoreductase n=1 Tax=Salininema proteolyticum TaxID=1607685 RepID=A0ABV8TUE8_9ACTN
MALTVDFDIFLAGGRVPDREPDSTLRDLVDYTKAAEEAGFDTAWVAEHHFIDYGLNPSAVTLASHLLAATQRIAVGTAVAMLGQRHPVEVGEETALLEALAPGRFRLGVGRGGPWVDLEVFNSSLERMERGFEESLTLLREWLTSSGDVWASGEFFQFRPVAPVPAAPYKPGDPNLFWVAAMSEGTARLAGRLGVPLLLGMQGTPQDHALLIDVWRHEADAAGHDAEAAQHAAAVFAQVLDRPGDREELRRRMTGLLRTTEQYQSLLSRKPRDYAAYVDFLFDTHAVGAPDEVVQKLYAAADVSGVSRQILFVEGMRRPEAVRDNIAAIGRTLG